MNIKDLRILFVGGIHGVGKTQFSTRTADDLNMTRLSASALITQQRNAPAAVNKRVHNVVENQGALIAAIEAQPIQSERILLDGHFCVFDVDDRIQRIPVKTFQELAPVGVVLLYDEVATIQVALRKRDGREFTTAVLKELQENEREHAEQICRSLEIPLHACRPTEYASARQFIERRV